MKILKLLLACSYLALCAPSLLAQQPVNESQTQADHDRQNPTADPASANANPPMRVRALFKNDSGTVTVTFLLLPGQTLKLFDPYYDFVKVTSDFPISIHGADCSGDQATDFDCRNIPENKYLMIDDSRVGVTPDSSPANRVKFIAVHHVSQN